MAIKESFKYETTDSVYLAEAIARMTGFGWIVVALQIYNPWWWKPWKSRYVVTFTKQEPVTDSLHFNFGPVSERIISQESGPR